MIVSDDRITSFVIKTLNSTLTESDKFYLAEWLENSIKNQASSISFFFIVVVFSFYGLLPGFDAPSTNNNVNVRRCYVGL